MQGVEKVLWGIEHVSKCFAKFHVGNSSPDDAPWSGRPVGSDSNQIETLIENNQHYTMWEIADILKSPNQYSCWWKYKICLLFYGKYYMDFLANPTHSFCCYSTGHIAPGELICVLVREWQWMANNASYYDENFWSCGSSLPPAKSSGGLQGLMEHTLRTHTLDIKPRKIRTISICSVRVTLYTRLPSPKVSV